MSNYCKSCPKNPDKATGEDACPFTALYWDFLNRHQKELSDNPRMKFQLKNLERKSGSELKSILKAAQTMRENPSKISNHES